MAAFVKFNKFLEALAEKAHNLGSDTLRFALTNTAPTAATDTGFLPGTLHPPPAAAHEVHALIERGELEVKPIRLAWEVFARAKQMQPGKQRRPTVAPIVHTEDQPPWWKKVGMSYYASDAGGTWDTYRMSVKPTTKTASGVVYAYPCIFHGFLIGTDGVNDPTITFYDHASAASGQEIVPTATYDASALGLNGVTGMYQYYANGIYLSITCAGTVEVTPQYAPATLAVGASWK